MLPLKKAVKIIVLASLFIFLFVNGSIAKTFSLLSFQQARLSNVQARNEQTVKNSFVIQNNQHQEKTEFYRSVIQKANLEGFRLKNQDIILKFDEGFDVVLPSAQSLYNKGVKIVVNSYEKEFGSGFRIPKFSILEDGTLHASYEKAVK